MLAVVSATSAAGVYFFSARTFGISSRPYIGITSGIVEITGEDKKTLSWTLTIKNSGNVPARVVIESNDAIVWREGKRVDTGINDLWSNQLENRRSLLMPGDSTDTKGDIHDQDPGGVDMILSGRAQFQILLRVTYESPAALWGRRRYFYWSVLQLNPAEDNALVALMGDAN